MSNVTKEMALDYHKGNRPGKIETVPTKPYSSQKDLSLAYSPGVAYPCLEIQNNDQDAYEYTNKLSQAISSGSEPNLYESTYSSADMVVKVSYNNEED